MWRHQVTEEEMRLLDLWEKEAREDLQKEWSNTSERIVFLIQELKQARSRQSLRTLGNENLLRRCDS